VAGESEASGDDDFVWSAGFNLREALASIFEAPLDREPLEDFLAA
jgi:hypothetical protein